MRFKELDGLRGLAALAVVVHHYFSWVRHSGAAYGWMGVDLFFVLSGFLITSILLELKERPQFFSTFYGRRAFRIFPPYFFVVGIYFVSAIALHHPGSTSLWMKYLFYYASLIPSRNLEANIPEFVRFGLAVLWSLSIEELFYTVWAPAIRFLKRNTFYVLLAGILIAAPILRYILHPQAQTTFFTLYCRMDGLAYGALVALILQYRRSNQEFAAKSDRVMDRTFAAFVVFFVGFFAIVGGDYLKASVAGAGTTIADLFFALLVYYVVRHTGEGSLLLRSLRNRALRNVGMVSYSVYLVHYPILILSQQVMAHVHLSRRMNALSVDALALLATFAVAYSMWYGFEAYSLKLKDRIFPSHGTDREPVTVPQERALSTAV